MSQATLAPTTRIRSLALTSRSLAPLAIWAALIVLAHLWGRALVSSNPDMGVRAPPLSGRLDLRLSPALLAPIGCAAAVAIFGPRVSRRLKWGGLVAAAVAAAAVWAISLSVVDGVSALAEPLADRNDYLRALPAISSPLDFLESFTAEIDRYPIHVRGHPPGMVLLLWTLDAVGLGGPGIAAALTILAGASCAGAVLLAARALAGEPSARRLAPWLVLMPAAIWIATSADALFAGVSAWGIAALVVATGRRGLRGDALAAGGGLLLGAAAMMSYGVVPLGIIVLAVAAARRRVRPVVVAAALTLAVLGTFAIFGFSWIAGLGATIEQYEAGIARHRPGGYFMIANLAALAIALGPGVARGLIRLRNPSLWLLVGGALAAVAVADLSGLSKGEVERIWLPFMPWLVIAAGSDQAGEGKWLAVQGGWAAVVQAGVRTPW